MLYFLLFLIRRRLSFLKTFLVSIIRPNKILCFGQPDPTYRNRTTLDFFLRKYRVFQFFKKTEQTIPKIFKTVALNTRFFWPYHKVIIIVCKIFMTFQWKHCLLNCNECWMDVSVFNTKFNLLYHSGQLTSPTVLVSGTCKPFTIFF